VARGKVWADFDGKDALRFGVFVGLGVGTFRGVLALLRRGQYCRELRRLGLGGGVPDRADPAADIGSSSSSIDSSSSGKAEGEGERAGEGEGEGEGEREGEGVSEPAVPPQELALRRTWAVDGLLRSLAGGTAALCLAVDGPQRRQTFALYAAVQVRWAGARWGVVVGGCGWGLLSVVVGCGTRRSPLVCCWCAAVTSCPKHAVASCATHRTLTVFTHRTHYRVSLLRHCAAAPLQALDTLRRSMERQGRIPASWAVDATLFGLCNGPIM
jgi:hypothetical protein